MAHDVSTPRPLAPNRAPAYGPDRRGRGRSSGVEHGVYTAGVGGSKPSARTIPASENALPAQTFRASLRALPALNRACFEAGILIG